MKGKESPQYALFMEIVDHDVAPLLLDKGFIRKKTYGSEGFHRDKVDAHQLIPFNMAWDHRAEVGKFDMFAQIYYPRLQELLHATPFQRPGEGNMPGMGGHVANIFNPPKELDWLVMDRQTDPDALRGEIIAAITQKVLPFLDTYAKLSPMIKLWEKGSDAHVFISHPYMLFLAMAYVAKGDQPKAIRYLQHCLDALDPDDPLASYEREDIQPVLAYLQKHSLAG
jgi:hypothetical protein